MTQNLRFSRRSALSLMTGGAALVGPTVARATVDPARFTHGVAAGDPLQNGFVIWTRAIGNGASVLLHWEVADDASFTRIIQSGTVQATAARDHTAKIDVTGLHAGREYFYRFHSANTSSTVGRARTLPNGDVERARLAVVSCSHYGFGYFNAYRAIADLEEPVDAVVHLGDYIYEYGVDGYGGPESRALGREHDPTHEIVTLDDYRRRFAQYRTDPDLQAAHARAAFITIWDDHETANNSWMSGSSAHDEDTEGPWDSRRDAAIQAYFEWLPMRDPVPGRPAHVLNRVYDFGDLLSLIAVETRLTGRTKAPSASRDMIFDAEGRPDPARFESEVLNRPERSMMGAAQEVWLEDALTASVQRGTAWQVLANQVIVARMRAPDFMSIMPDDMLQDAISRAGSRRWLESTRLSLPINLDAWDGYPTARLRLYDAARRSGANLAVLSGDTHMFWGNRLHDPRDEAFVGVEFGTGSVTSPGGYETISADLRIYEIAETALVAKNPDVRFAHVRDHGFLIVEISKAKLTCSYYQIADIKTRDTGTHCFAQITVDRHGAFQVRKTDERHVPRGTGRGV